MIYRFLLITILVSLWVAPTQAAMIDWWLTPDQQGRYYFERGEFQKAARAFESEEWKAMAFYKSGDFANAAALFQKSETPEGYFHLGNALARQEQLAPAVEAYQRALELQPDFPAATFNLDWVQGLLELDSKEYEDVGGTGGKLGADRVVFDEVGAKAKGEMSAQQLQAEKGLTDDQLRDMWMRRVQTTPGDFLKLKFSYQLNSQGKEDVGEEGQKQ